jgi:hypothetical protein
MNVGFALGNGPSRKLVDLEQLRGKGWIYGCNALYRDFVPDVLCAIDSNMIVEVNEAKYDHPFVWRKPGGGLFRREMHAGQKTREYRDPGWACGPISIHVMLDDHPEIGTIYLIGHDVSALPDGSSNIYAGTRNYPPATRIFENFISRMALAISQHPEVEFVRVSPPEVPVLPSKWVEQANFRSMLTAEFLKDVIGAAE